MKLNFSKLGEPAGLKVTYNGQEIFRKDLIVANEDIIIETPQETGTAQSYLVRGEKEIPIGSATYWFPDVAGAQVRITQASELSKNGKNWPARTKLLEAVRILEKLSPNSGYLADAYLSLCWIHYFAKCRVHKRAQRKAEGVAWYRKALAVWEHNGDVDNLRPNLTNFGVLLRRYGDVEGARSNLVRALEMQRSRDNSNAGNIAAWTQTAGFYLSTGELDEAEAVIKDGLTRFGAETPNCAYLYETWSGVHFARAHAMPEQADAMEAQAVALHRKAVALQPPDSCPIG